MSDSNPIVKITKIYGVDVKNATIADLMSNIKTAKNEMKVLAEVGVDSVFVRQQIASHEEALALSIRYLDQFAAKEKATLAGGI